MTAGQKHILVLALALFWCAGCAPTAGAAPVANAGVLDLRHRDFDRQGALPLAGQWTFFPGELSAPSAPDAVDRNDGANPRQAEVPGAWNTLAIDGQEFGALGYGTYRLKLLLPADAPELALRLPLIESAYVLYWNEREIARHGRPAAGREPLEGARPIVVKVPNASPALLTFQVANYDHRDGGLTGAPVIDTASRTFRRRDSFRVLETFLLGILFVMVFYHLFLWNAHRADRALLWFSLLCSSVMVRVLLTGQCLMVEALPAVAWQTFKKLEYLSYFLSVLLALAFFRSLYPRLFAPRLFRGLMYWGLPLSAAALVLPAPAFTYLLFPFHPLTLIGGAYLASVLIRAIRAREPGAGLIFAGYFLSFLASINDILFNHFQIGPGYLISIAFLFFILSQAAALARRTAFAFSNNAEFSRGLERQVDERTAELRKLASVTRLANESTQLDEIVETVVGYVREEFLIDGVILMLADESKGELYTVHTTIPPAADASVPAYARGLRLSLDSDSALVRVLQKGRPLYAPRTLKNVPAPAIDLEILDKLQVRGYYAVPLSVRGRSVGLMLLSTYDKPLKLDRDMRARVNRYCDQVAGGVLGAALTDRIEREREEAEQARAESELLANITRRANEGRDLEEVLALVYELMREKFDADSVALFMLDESGDNLRLHGGFLRGRQIPPEEMPEVMRLIPMNESTGSIYRTFRRKKITSIPRLDRDTLERFGTPVDRAVAEASGLEWFAHVPLLVKGDVVGIITITGSTERRISRADLALCDRLGAQIAGAMQTVNLLAQIEAEREKAEKARGEALLLADLARRANAARSLGEILEPLHAILNERFDADRISLHIVRDRRLELASLFRDGRGVSLDSLPATARSLPLAPETGTLYRTFRRQRLLHLTEIPKELLEQSPVDRLFAERFAVGWLVQVPLLAEGDTVAILGFSGTRPRRLNSAEKEFCSALAAQLAGPVRAHDLLQQTAEANREIQFLIDTARAINETTDIDRTLDLVFDHLRTNMSVRDIVMQVVDEKRNELRTIRSTTERARPQTDFVMNLRVPLRPDSGTLYSTFQRQRPLYRPRISDRFPSELDRRIAGELELTNFLQVPLVIEQKTIGILWMTLDGPRRPRAEIDRIARFCDQIAGTLHRANLLEEVAAERERTEQAHREALSLAELARRVNEGRDLLSILKAVTDIFIDRFAADNLSFYLVDARRAILKLSAAYTGGDFIDTRNSPEILREIPLEPASGSLFQACRKKRLFHTDRVTAGYLERFAVDRAFAETTGIRWVVDAPLIVEGEVLGILALGGKDPRRLGPAELAFCERVAAQVAGAVRMLDLLRETAETRRDTERLLANILPESVARELRENGVVEPLYYDSVSVLFTDFVGFTQLSEEMLPDELVQELDGCFSQFDDIIKRNNLEKLKTIGDAYMCAGGLPDINNTHAVDICLAALEFRSFMEQMAEIKRATGDEYWSLRIGIHSGPVTSGVIGKSKFAYDIWGDTVNTASRMESAGEPGRINISAETYELVKNYFVCDERGMVEAKGKGLMTMYFLERIKPEFSTDDRGLVPNERFHEERKVLAVYPF